MKREREREGGRIERKVVLGRKEWASVCVCDQRSTRFAGSRGISHAALGPSSLPLVTVGTPGQRTSTHEHEFVVKLGFR